MSSDLDRRGLGLLGGAHLSVDLCQAAVPALLPFFVDQRGYSYAAAGALVFAATVGSSLIQPLFGHAADRLQLPWLMPAGVIAAGAGIALSGVTASYALTFAAIVLSGIGVAAFHPEGARHANYASGVAKARGMSLFALGGNAGFALGPVLTTGCVLALGLSGTLVLGLHPDRRGHDPRGEAGPAARAARPRRGGGQGGLADRPARPVGRVRPPHRRHLAALVRALRPAQLRPGLVRHHARHLRGGRQHRAHRDARLGRRWDRDRRARGGSARPADDPARLLALAGPALAAFIEAPTGLAFVLIAVVGFTVVGTFAITVVLGQEYLPNRLGMASGVTLGAAIGVGGALAPVLGALADAQGIETAMWVIAAIPVPALLLALTLPVEGRLGLRRQVPKTRSPASPSPGRM